MSDAASAEQDSAPYFRGASARDVGTRKVLRVTALCYVLAMLIAAGILTAVGVRDMQQTHRLHQGGQPGILAVAHCLGMASGTGITAAGYRCTGVVTLKDGTAAVAVLKDLATPYAPGTQLNVVADPQDAASVYTPAAVARMRRGWTALVPAAVTVLFALAGVALVQYQARVRALL